MNALYTLSVLLVASLTGCGDKSDDTADTAAGGGGQVSVDCTSVTSVARHWGGSTGPCGPEYMISVDNTGAVFTSSSADPNLPEGSDECDVQTTNSTIDAADATAMLLNICEGFNECVYAEIELADGAYDATGLYSGDDVLVSTSEVSCAEGIPDFEELFDIWMNATMGG